jgi:hypothetical protein
MRRRRAVAILVGGTILLALLGGSMPTLIQESLPKQYAVLDESKQEYQAEGAAADALNQLFVKGRAPKTGYDRNQFGNGWGKVNGCSTRDIILYRDLTDVVLEDECSVVRGTLDDPYTGEIIQFDKTQSSDVQIDHVVALSDAWQKGAQQLTIERRKELANDPLNLLAVDGPANQQKSDGDAATWLPSNKSFRCSYVARQIAVKQKYTLWVTGAEKEAMARILEGCPGQAMPTL